MTMIFRPEAVPLAPEQLELRQRVLKQAEAHPDTFNMRAWEATWRDPATGECGTVRCIAGWAQFLARGRVDVGDFSEGNVENVEKDAVRLLGLTRREYCGYCGDSSRPCTGLFYLRDDAALRRLRKLADARLPGEDGAPGRPA